MAKTPLQNQHIHVQYFTKILTPVMNLSKGVLPKRHAFLRRPSIFWQGLTFGISQIIVNWDKTASEHGCQAVFGLKYHS